jgi:nitrogen fixation/metabolism regulation signal transduction histidine kinase
MKPRCPRLSHDGRVLGLSLSAGLPGVLVAEVLLVRGSHLSATKWTLGLIVAGAWLKFCWDARTTVVHQLQSLANLLATLREGDFSIRGRRERAGAALGGVLDEINSLGDTLRRERLGALEASALLAKVMWEIDIAVFAFDGERRLRLLNRAGEELLGRPADRLLGQDAESLGMTALLGGDPQRRVDLTFRGGRGTWEMRRNIFRQSGLPHELLVLTDLQRARREEETQAWQRLVRVLGHEINNSLAPIQSIARSLQDAMKRDPPAPDWKEDVAKGLAVVERRAEGLGRFLHAYASVAKLPAPRFAPVDVGAWVQRVAELEKRTGVRVLAGPMLAIEGDTDQLDQMLINLVRNAADAAQETRGAVAIEWQRAGQQLELRVTDEGPGLADTANLFVPFFTTKLGGSGIGLVLSRQIAEAHRGSLVLRNRAERTGCEAVLRLPLAPSKQNWVATT